VRADAAAADDDDKGRAQRAQAVVAEEDAVARQLLEDQLVVEVAVLRAVGQRLVVLVFGVGFGEGAGAGYLEGREGGLAWWGEKKGGGMGRREGGGVCTDWMAGSVSLLVLGCGIDCFRRETRSPCCRRW
jgi:hypothetical protein